MLVPSMLNMADVMADSGFTEEEVFDCGISGQIIFLAVVPLIGACRVPVEALSHFMAGADNYAAEGMPEHWSGALSGKWTIKRDRLRILPQSWEALSDNLYKLAESLDAASEPKEADTSPSVDDWKDKARAIADRLALERYKRGERQITARNICDAVATELAKDTTTHGIRGERSGGNIRNEALKGWKFIPPTGTSGTSGTRVARKNKG